MILYQEICVVENDLTFKPARNLFGLRTDRKGVGGLNPLRLNFKHVLTLAEREVEGFEHSTNEL